MSSLHYYNNTMNKYIYRMKITLKLHNILYKTFINTHKKKIL